MNALDSLLGSGNNQLYDSSLPGNRGRSALPKPSTSTRSKTKRANKALARTASGKNYSGALGVTRNPSLGIRPTPMPQMSVGLLPAPDKKPPRPPLEGKPMIGVLPGASLSRIKSIAEMAGVDLSKPSRGLLDPKKITGIPDLPKSDVRVVQRSGRYTDPTDFGNVAKGGLPAMTRRNDLTDDEKNAFAERRAARKDEKALRRQRQFARAQMRSGEMFNEDGTADLVGSMAAQSFEQNPQLAAALAMARHKGNIAAEDNAATNAIDQLLAGEQIDQGQYDRGKTAHQRQIELLTAEAMGEVAETPSELQSLLSGLQPQPGGTPPAPSRPAAPADTSLEQRQQRANSLEDLTQLDSPDQFYNGVAGFTRSLAGASPEEVRRRLRDSPYTVHDLRALAERPLSTQWDFGLGWLSTSDDQIAVEKARKDAAMELLRKLSQETKARGNLDPDDPLNKLLYEHGQPRRDPLAAFRATDAPATDRTLPFPLG